MERFNADSADYRAKTVQSLMSLEGRVVVVTGGGRGLGLSIGVGCAELGAKVALFDILDEPTEELALLERENGVKLHYFHANVAEYASLSEAFVKVEKSLGPVFHALVNCAGIGLGGSFVECDRATMDRILAVNVTGTLYGSQIAAQHMTKHGQGGSIVNISSIGGHAAIPLQRNAVYCASKGAVLAFTKSLAVELAPAGIRVNSVSPGFFLTRVTPGYNERDVARLESFERSVPLGRFADRGELKSTVAFLLSEAASYITGEDIAVDGGVLAA